VGLLILVRLVGDNTILLLDNQHRNYSVIDSVNNSWHKLGIGDNMQKLIIIVTALAALIILPPIKVVYDELVITMLPAVSPNDFVTAFFKLLPYGLLGLIIFGTIYKLFRPQPPTGGPPV